MQDEADKSTQTLPGVEPVPVKRGRGRPAKEGAKTNAQRQAEWRARHRPVDLGAVMSRTVQELAESFDLDQGEVIRELVRFALTNKDWRKLGFSGIYASKRASV